MGQQRGLGDAPVAEPQTRRQDHQGMHLPLFMRWIWLVLRGLPRNEATDALLLCATRFQATQSCLLIIRRGNRDIFVVCRLGIRLPINCGKVSLPTGQPDLAGIPTGYTTASLFQSLGCGTNCSASPTSREVDKSMPKSDEQYYWLPRLLLLFLPNG